MSIRHYCVAALVAALVLAAVHGPARSFRIEDAASAQAAEKTPKLTDLLSRRVSLEKPFDGKFKDAVELLAEKYELPIVLDPALREFPAAAAQCDGLEDRPVKLPKMISVRVETLLRLACEQADAMFLVYPDYVRIVPAIFGLHESGVVGANSDTNESDSHFLTPEQLLKTRPLTRRAVVNLSFKDTPVTEILDEIAARSGANVALAPVVNEKAHAKLTVRFSNTPVDAAVRTLCEMADLAMIEDANVLVVTTRERAAARLKSEADQKRAELILANSQLFQPNVLGGFGGLGGPGGDATDLGTEIAKLKTQNELLRQKLDEVMKLLKK